MSFMKKVLHNRIERSKTVAYWLMKCFRLGLFYVFKDEIIVFARTAFTWLRANFSLIATFHTITFIGFVAGMLIFLAILLEMLIKHEDLETLPDKIESFLKEMNSILEKKMAHL